MYDDCFVLRRFLYPTDNRVGHVTGLKWHEVVLQRERDLQLEPLHPVTFRKRPKLRRDGPLDYTYDFRAQMHKKYYRGSMRKIRDSYTPLRQIGIYDETHPDVPPMLYHDLYTDSRMDESMMREKLREVNRWLIMNTVSKVAAIFPLAPKKKLITSAA